MTTQIHQGDIFKTTHGILVHSCDAESGAHSALLETLRLRYPGAVRAYKEALDSGKPALGQVAYYQVPSPGDDQLIIASAIMQRGAMPDIGAAQACLQSIAEKARATGLPVHFAALPNVPAPMLTGFLDGALGTAIEHHLWQPA